MSWEGAPDKIQSYVLIATDWDGPTPRLRLGNFTHWILYNIPQDVHEIKSAVTPAELTQKKIETGENSSNAAAYMLPCPPLGKHRYAFRLGDSRSHVRLSLSQYELSNPSPNSGDNPVNNRFAVIETSTPFSRLCRTDEILTTINASLVLAWASCPLSFWQPSSSLCAAS